MNNFENINYLIMRSNNSLFYQELINILLKKLALKESNIDFYLKCETLNLFLPKFKVFIKKHKDLINQSLLSFLNALVTSSKHVWIFFSNN